MIPSGLWLRNQSTHVHVSSLKNPSVQEICKFCTPLIFFVILRSLSIIYVGKFFLSGNGNLVTSILQKFLNFSLRKIGSMPYYFRWMFVIFLLSTVSCWFCNQLSNHCYFVLIWQLKMQTSIWGLIFSTKMIRL